ncbi:MAG: hypothetical protein HYY04_09450, partial [Chloroflexi bacterium]|nr:hypothetical protein [Chloroflexota bacterium]
MWVYAPGWIGDTLTQEGTRDLTGMDIRLMDVEERLRVEIDDYAHPYTRDLRGPVVYGTTNPVRPFFYVDDANVQRLGRVAGWDLAGLAVRSFPEWTSVYSAAPDLPAGLLQGIARTAGVHIYDDHDDILYVNRHLLCVDPNGRGEREIRLPWPRDVYDVLGRRPVASGQSRFRVWLEPQEVGLYLLADPG